MILLRLELVPSSLARKLMFFMLARSVGGVAAALVFLFFSIPVGLLLLICWLLLSVGYFFYLYRLALSVFLLAARAFEAAPGQPVGRDAPAPDVSSSGL